MRFLLLIVCIVGLASCKDKYDVEKYYSKAEQDSVVADIITYVYNRPPYSNAQTKFEPKFRSYYVSSLKNMRVEKFFIAKDGTHYFYIIRPSSNTPLGLRGVGGMFKRDVAGKITRFKEVFVTPGSALPDLQTRGEELFREMVRTGNVDAYVKNPDYIEWPARWNYYDTLQHEWLSKPGV
jgi:hypothetical protein